MQHAWPVECLRDALITAIRCGYAQCAGFKSNDMHIQRTKRKSASLFDYIYIFFCIFICFNFWAHILVDPDVGNILLLIWLPATSSCLIDLISGVLSQVDGFNN